MAKTMIRSPYDLEVTKENAIVPGRDPLDRELVKRISNNKVPPFPNEKFGIIYADPPWEYFNTPPDKYGPASRHYPTLSLENICNLPVKNIKDKNCVLFLWTTSPMLEDAFKVIQSWEFTYKSSFVWIKEKHNYGYYNFPRHEFLLVGVDGKGIPKKLYPSTLSAERGKHSKKPAYFRDIIEIMYPESKKIELFARKKIDGWEAWGNEL